MAREPTDEEIRNHYVTWYQPDEPTRAREGDAWMVMDGVRTFSLGARRKEQTVSEDPAEIREYILVFNCVTCGTLLSCDNGAFLSSAICPNCGAFYAHNSTGVIHRYNKGRAATQWKSNGWSPPKEPTT